MFDQTDFIREFQEQAEQGGEMDATHGRDKWLRAAITLFAVLVAGYTTVHGISATLHYRAGGTAGLLTGIVGIVVLEGLFLVLSHGLIHGTFKGSRLHVGLMVAATAVSLAFMLLNTVIDAQLNASMVLTENLAAYFRYVLPISSVIATVIALAGLYFAPDAERARQRGEAVNAYKQQQFISYMAARNAELMVQRGIANAQLGARISAAKTVAAHYQSDEVRGLIEGAAVASIPSLLRAIGVNDTGQARQDSPAQMDSPGRPSELPELSDYEHNLVTDYVAWLREAEHSPLQPTRPGRNGREG